MAKRNIDLRFRKPRRAKGTPFYVERNYLALGVCAISGLSWFLFEKWSVTKKLKQRMAEGDILQDPPGLTERLQQTDFALIQAPELGPLVAKLRERQEAKAEAEYEQEEEGKPKPCSSKCKKISKYFAKPQVINETSSPATSNEESLDNTDCLKTDSPYKNSLKEINSQVNDSLSDEKDFMSPKPTAEKKKLPLPNRSPPKAKIKQKTRQVKKKPVRSFQKTIEDSFKNLDVNADHLQLAIALSVSAHQAENPEQYDAYAEESFPSFSDSQQRRNYVKSTLEQFGFKSDRAKINSCFPRSFTEVFKKRKKSKFSYITPTLLLRTDEDREAIITSKVSVILSQRLDTQYGNGVDRNYELFSEKLRNYNQSVKSFFKINTYKLEDLNCNEIFYTKPLSLPICQSPCGCLLRDWKDIPGRQISPQRKIKEATDVEEIVKIDYENEKYETQELNVIEKSPKRSISPDLFADDENDVIISTNSQINSSNLQGFDAKRSQTSKFSLEEFEDDNGICHFESFHEDVVKLTQERIANLSNDEVANHIFKKDDSNLKSIEIDLTISSSDEDDDKLSLKWSQNISKTVSTQKILENDSEKTNSEKLPSETDEMGKLSSFVTYRRGARNLSNRTMSGHVGSKIISTENEDDILFINNENSSKSSSEKTKLDHLGERISKNIVTCPNLERTDNKLCPEKFSYWENESRKPNENLDPSVDNLSKQVTTCEKLEGIDRENINLDLFPEKLSHYGIQNKQSLKNPPIKDNIVYDELLDKNNLCERNICIEMEDGSNQNERALESSESPKRSSSYKSEKTVTKPIDDVYEGLSPSEDDLEKNANEETQIYDLSSEIIIQQENIVKNNIDRFSVGFDINFSGSKNLNVTDYINNVLNKKSFETSRDITPLNCLKSNTSNSSSNEKNKTVDSNNKNDIIISDEICNEIDNIPLYCSQASQESNYLSDEELNYSSNFNSFAKRKSKAKKRLDYYDDVETEEIETKKSDNIIEILDESSPELTPPDLSSNKVNSLLLNDSFDCVLENLNMTTVTNHLDNLVKPKPDRKETPKKITDNATTSFVQTPKNTLIIKTDNVTPMADYETMDTPKIVKELDKFGLKPLKRQRGVQLLKYIYDSTHPMVEPKGVGYSDDEDNSRNVKKLKKSTQNEVKAKCVNNRPQVSSIRNYHFNSIGIVGDIIPVGNNPGDLIFERRQSSKIPSCRIPLDIVWHNFISSNKQIKENILLYEPLQLEVLHAMLKEEGFKFHVQDLLTFLDRKCITVRTAQSQGNGRRRR